MSITGVPIDGPAKGIVTTKKEAVFLRALAEGLPPAAAAAKAGYTNPSATARALMLRPHIRDALAKIQAEMAANLNVSRAKVFSMLNEAWEMAQLKEDAQAMIRVASEISKLCGYYPEKGGQVMAAAQEVERLERYMEQSPVAELSDDELRELVGEDGKP